MASDDFAQALLQACNLKGALEANGNGKVISRVARLKLVKKPETLLGEGKRGWAGRVPARDSGKLIGFCFVLAQDLSQPGNCGTLEDMAQGELVLESLV